MNNFPTLTDADLVTATGGANMPDGVGAKFPFDGGAGRKDPTTQIGRPWQPSPYNPNPGSAPIGNPIAQPTTSADFQ